MSFLPRSSLLLALLPVFALACSGQGSDPTKGGASLHRFASEEELTSYLEAASPLSTGSSSGGFADAGAATSAGSSASPAPASEGASSAPTAPAGDASGKGAAGNETITNNQEAGVDEGGIVKNVGDALVVLRKGRLYAVSVAEAGAPRQTDSIPVASSESLNNSVWYDEMLVRGDHLYVIGYRYGLTVAAGADAADDAAAGAGYPASYGATEVASFRLAAGRVERLKTLFIESNDYFSGTNYASRMIDGKLVFYMPHGVWRGYGTDRKLHIPRFFTPNADGTFSRGARVFTPTDVYVPLDVPESPAFHTIVKCELPSDGGFTCNARSLLSGYGREHYVTPGAVFLWSLPRAYMFRFEDLGVVAHKAAATPLDQFSFKLDGGVLHMTGRAWTAPKKVSAAAGGSGGTGLGGFEQADAPVAEPSVSPSSSPGVVVESLPLADFDVYGEQSLAHKERAVAIGGAGDSLWVSKNRFVGPSLFLGVESYGGATGTTAARIIRFELGSGATTSRDVAGSVVRIEPLGASRALVAVQSSTALDLESLPTDGALAPLGAEHVAGLSQGESRSQGFFFKPSADGGGAFGLPVMNHQGTSGAGSDWYGSGISNIGFWAVAPTGAMSALGVISSSKEVGVCETSCVDWYGNTRPIFLGDRTFALMGSELAEIAVAPAAARIGTPAVLQ